MGALPWSLPGLSITVNRANETFNIFPSILTPLRFLIALTASSLLLNLTKPNWLLVFLWFLWETKMSTTYPSNLKSWKSQSHVMSQGSSSTNNETECSHTRLLGFLHLFCLLLHLVTSSLCVTLQLLPLSLSFSVPLPEFLCLSVSPTPHLSSHEILWHFHYLK